MNTQRERKLGNFDSFKKLSFVWTILLINLMSDNDFKASNADVKNSHEYCVI